MKPQTKVMVREMPRILPVSSQQPCVIQLHGTKLSLINPFNGNKEEWSMPEMQGKVCLGCFGEWIVLLHRKSKRMSLLNLKPTSGSVNEIELPAMSEPFESLGSFALSSSPMSPKCVIVFVGNGRDFMLYSRPKDQKWTKIRPVLDRCYRGDIAISQGKIYASLQPSDVVVIDLESLPTGAIDGEIIKSPESTVNDNENNHLVISGESVFFVSVKISSADVFIYKLDTSKLPVRRFRLLDGVVRNCTPWERIESINRRVFLLGGDYCMSIPENHVGVQCNCMYLLRPHEDGLRRYTICLDDQTTTYKLLLPEATNARNRLYWVVPNRSRSIKRRTMKTSAAFFSKGEGRTNDISVPWANIPVGIVEEILSFLPLPDRIRLASVCKSWSSLSKFIRDSKIFPWLMCSSHSGSLKFFDPSYGVEHSLQMKWLGSDGKLTLHFSKDGWVIASDREQSLFILNPLTRQAIKLPSLQLNQVAHMSFSFSSVPTYSDCIVLGVHKVNRVYRLFTWHRGRLSWSTEFIVEFLANPFCPASASPIFFCDEFYMLGGQGVILVFNPAMEKCRLLRVPTPTYSRKEDCYLLELDGDLIYMLKGNTTIVSESYSVYKLDRSKTDWVELEDFGDVTVFLSRRNSVWRPSMKGMYANGMLFPRFHGEDIKAPAFYSMQSHTFQPKSEDMKEVMNCVWFEPNLSKSRRKIIKKLIKFLV